MKPNKKISQFNDEFDWKIFLHVVKKVLPYIIIIFAFSLAVSFLYLRYTYPQYRASSIIQIHTDDVASQVLGSMVRVDLNQKIEVLKSRMFLERVFKRLPLDVSYFREGRFLNTELYRSTPFTVSYNIKNSSFYDKPVYIDINTNGQCILRYKENGNELTHTFSLLDTARLQYADIFVVLHNPNAFRRQSFLEKEEYFFVINNPNKIVEYYASKLRISILNPASQSIEVSITDRHPVKAADIVNKIAEEFNLYDVERQAESTEKILDFIDDQLDLFYEKLHFSQQEIDAYKNEHNIDAFIVSSDNLFSKVAAYEEEIFKLQMEAAELKKISDLILYQEGLDVYELYALIIGADIQSMVASNLTNIQNLLMQREILLYNVTENSIAIKQLEYRLDIQKKLLAQSINVALQNTLARKQNIKETLREYKMAIAPAVDNKNIGELSILQRVYQANESFYNNLLDKKAQHTINKAGFVSQNVILKDATVPEEHVSPIEARVYLFAFFVSVILSFVLIALKYLLYNNISYPRDISRFSDIPILGVVPNFSFSIPGNQIVVDNKPKSLIAESLRAIRTNLQFVNSIKGPKVVSLTSTISTEGKSFVALNLAAITAASFKKVIVVDMDLRKPKVHKAFKVDNKKGVSTILSGLDEIDKCIHKSHIENLDFITAGPIPPNPAELTQTDNMSQMISYLKKIYDFIVIDNAPIGIVIDGMRSMQIADYPIYILRAGYSKKIFLQNVEGLRRESKIANLAVILNDVNMKKSGFGLQSYAYDSSFGYGYGYGYGHGYYEEEDDVKKKYSFWNRLKNIFNDGS